MAKVEKIRDVIVKSGDLFFFDNNVWMYLFSPISGANSYQQRMYGNLLRNIQVAKASIFINSLIVSEYINRSLRLNYSIWREFEAKTGNRFLDYKRDYRPTSEFEDAKIAVCEEMDNILHIAYRKPDDFNALDVTRILQAPAMDFNDAYYANFCHLNNLTLVTDDRDLFNTPLDIKIITA